MKETRGYPVFTITQKGTRWVETGDPWIYDAEVTEGPDCPNGALVDAVSPKGKYLGTGFYTEPRSFCALPGAESISGVAFCEHEIANHLVCVCTRGGEEVEFVRWEGVS